MTYAFVLVLAGYTPEHYDAVARCLGEGPFPGLLAHLAGPCDGGWRIIQVWESADDYLRYERGPLADALDKSRAVNAGSPPMFEQIHISHVMLGPGG